ncbi:unnamed protein product [Prorocentrum cordatum]|uniref:DNA2/NAM7 helicase helicase domain-containing protein n=1 Tax=Prorocentrum cordatum TaxID=2364126 RepID=A0ABN9SJ54_9DINO|nr:unnamed protein product [Polarella glacialis]
MRANLDPNYDGKTKTRRDLKANGTCALDACLELVTPTRRHWFIQDCKLEDWIEESEATDKYAVSRNAECAPRYRVDIAPSAILREWVKTALTNMYRPSVRRGDLWGTTLAALPYALAFATDDNGETQCSNDIYRNPLSGHFLLLRGRAGLGGQLLDPDHFGDRVSRPDALEPITDAEVDEHPGSVWQRANNVPAEDTIEGVIAAHDLTEDHTQALRSSVKHLVAAVQGPPGTGKARFAAALASARAALYDLQRTNALDILTHRLPATSHYRRAWNTEPNRSSKSKRWRKFKDDLSSTCSIIIAIHEGPWRLDQPKAPKVILCVIDEAGQVYEVSAAISIDIMSTGANIALAGDPKQLPPTVQSWYAEYLGLQVPLSEKFNAPWARTALPQYFSQGSPGAAPAERLESDAKKLGKGVDEFRGEISDLHTEGMMPGDGQRVLMIDNPHADITSNAKSGYANLHEVGDGSTSPPVANLPERPKGCLQKRASKDCRGSPAGMGKAFTHVLHIPTTSLRFHIACLLVAQQLNLHAMQFSVMLALAVCAYLALAAPAATAFLGAKGGGASSPAPDATGAQGARLAELEDALRPTFAALPKDAAGGLSRRAVRYALHRLFVQRHGWYVRGLEPGTGSVGTPLHGLLERHAPSSGGAGLPELAAAAAALEDLVAGETSERVRRSYGMFGHSTGASLGRDEVLEVIVAYYVGFLDGGDLEASGPQDARREVQSFAATYSGWADAEAWLLDVIEPRLAAGAGSYDFGAAVRMAVEVAHQYHVFNDLECRSLKATMSALEGHRAGRVRLPAFYRKGLHSHWRFDERPEYLRAVGALDESEPEAPSVILPNYMSARTNCLEASGSYALCCRNECEDLLGHLEAHVGAPQAPELEVVRLVAALPSGTVEAPRFLPSALLGRLSDIAAASGGLVPLHGRLFAQWMHHAFPRECPYPHESGAASPQTPDEWMRQTGEETHKLSRDEMARQVEEDVCALELEAGSAAGCGGGEELPWSDSEELLDGPPGGGRQALVWVAALYAATGFAAAAVIRRGSGALSGGASKLS